MKTLIKKQIEKRMLDVTVEQAVADFNYWIDNIADTDVLETETEEQIEVFFNEDEDYTCDLDLVAKKRAEDAAFDEKRRKEGFKSSSQFN